jgi:hypothetical protein
LGNTLDYARPDSLNPRTSKLAVASMLAALADCPCVVAFIIQPLLIGSQLPWLTAWAISLLLIFVVALVALARIRRSNGMLQGVEYCNFAFCFCGCWTAMAIGAWWWLSI